MLPNRNSEKKPLLHDCYLIDIEEEKFHDDGTRLTPEVPSTQHSRKSRRPFTLFEHSGSRSHQIAHNIISFMPVNDQARLASVNRESANDVYTSKPYAQHFDATDSNVRQLTETYADIALQLPYWFEQIENEIKIATLTQQIENEVNDLTSRQELTNMQDYTCCALTVMFPLNLFFLFATFYNIIVDHGGLDLRADFETNLKAIALDISEILFTMLWTYFTYKSLRAILLNLRDACCPPIPRLRVQLNDAEDLQQFYKEDEENQIVFDEALKSYLRQIVLQGRRIAIKNPPRIHEPTSPSLGGRDLNQPSETITGVKNLDEAILIYLPMKDAFHLAVSLNHTLAETVKSSKPTSNHFLSGVESRQLRSSYARIAQLLPREREIELHRRTIERLLADIENEEYREQLRNVAISYKAAFFGGLVLISALYICNSKYIDIPLGAEIFFDIIYGLVSLSYLVSLAQMLPRVPGDVRDFICPPIPSRQEQLAEEKQYLETLIAASEANPVDPVIKEYVRNTTRSSR
ncbi:MAG: hypothetical protein SFW66_10460 [Gammaproteobacteria bacterium]|nr:hypothetical protein [Gammaproteobacteria bacterium]